MSEDRKQEGLSALGHKTAYSTDYNPDVLEAFGSGFLVDISISRDTEISILFHHFLLIRPPLSADRAAAEHLRGFRAAGRADILDGGLCHLGFMI